MLLPSGSMSRQSSPAELRILQSVTTILGAQDSLQSINTTLVSDRALVVANENDSIYVLRKDSVAPPSGTDIVQPAAGPGRWVVYPAGSEAPIAPIQNTRYWEPGFVGTANGSIAAPYPLLAPFMAELDASASVGWLLYIPGTGNLVQDAPVPDLIEGALVVSGIFPEINFSYISSPWVIEPQSGSGSYMAFRDLWLSSLVINGPGSLQLNFSNCFIDALTVNTGLEGTAVFRDTGAANIAFPATDNFDIKMYGGGLSGDCSWRGGEIFNASIGGGSTYVLGLAVTRFVGCTFGTGITISNVNTPTLEMDTFSHSTFISAGVTFAGTVIVLS